MKPVTRKLWIGVALFVVLILSFAVYGIRSIYSSFGRIGTLEQVSIPPEIQQTRVLKGESFLARSEFFKLEKSDNWEVIKSGLSIEDEKERAKWTHSESAKMFWGFDDIRFCGDEVIAAGKFGGYIFDRNGRLKRRILFEPKTMKIKILGFEEEAYTSVSGDIRIINLKNDDKCEFVSNDSVDGVTVFDDQGNIAWRYGERPVTAGEAMSKEERDKQIYITNVDVLDLDGDGSSEFIISQRNDGIRVLDRDKNEQWFQPDKFPIGHFRLADVDGDGSNLLIEFQGGRSAIRDKKTGKVLKHLKIEYGTGDFVAFEDGNKKNTVQLFRFDENRLIVTDINNKTVFESAAPLSEIEVKSEKSNLPTSGLVALGNGTKTEPAGTPLGIQREVIYQPRAVMVRLKKNKPRYLAIIASFVLLPRSNLYVYEPNGNLVYQELLPESAETIATLPLEDGSEEILVGGKGTIWKFRTN